jgi:hypothetical protein
MPGERMLYFRWAGLVSTVLRRGRADDWPAANKFN